MIGIILVAGRLSICCQLLGTDMKPMLQVPMASQYWSNISQQSIANGNPIIEPMWLNKRTPTPISPMGN